MKTLLQINALVNTGSTGRIVDGIGQLAMDHGWKSYIAYGRVARESRSGLIPVGNKFSIGWHGLVSRLSDRHGFASTSATLQLIQEIRKLSPDIIHLHNLHGYYLNVKILFDFLAETNIPVVWTLHDCWAMTGHCAHFQNNGCDKWRSGCMNCQFLVSYPASWGWDASRRNFMEKKSCFTSVRNMTIVPVCRWLEGIVKESYLGKYPLRTILNGIDIRQFAPVETGSVRDQFRLEGKFVILAVASQWYAAKGYVDILSLCEYLNEDEVILLVGVDAAQRKNLPRSIIGIRRMESVSDLTAYYSMADVFINPTYHDTFPTVNLEALACGTPVVTYDTGGCAESVDQTTGYVVRRGDLAGLYAAISAVREKGKKEFASACRKRVEHDFDDRRQYQEYMNLYQNILKDEGFDYNSCL